MHTILVNNLPFNIHPGPVGIAFSGGADSSILMYTMLKNITSPIHVFTCSIKDRSRSQPYHAYRVLTYLLDKTKRNDVYFHTYFVKRKSKETIFAPINELIKVLNLSTVYTAGTSFPSKEDLKSFVVDKELDPTWLYSIRDPDITKPVYHADNLYYSPWWNMDKKFIAEIYKQENLLDELFPLTRSCENSQYTEGHCGVCWFCAERKWAFSKL
jgi:hypothetical protein